MNSSENSNDTTSTMLANYEPIINAINFYGPLCYMLPGIVLNVLTAIVYSRKPFVNTNMGFFYTCLSLSSACSLAVGVVIFLPLSFGLDVTTLSPFSCCFFNYIKRFFIKLSSWCEVLVSVDRIVSVCYSNQVAFFRVKRNMWLLFVGMSVALGLVFASDAMYNYSDGTESQSNNSAAAVEEVVGHATCTTPIVTAFISDTISTTFRTFIPFTIMVAINVIIINQLLKSKRAVAMNGTNATGKISFKEYHFTVAIFSINCVFLVTQLPLSFVQLSQNVFKIVPETPKSTLNLMNLLSNLAFLIVYLFEANQFTLNVIFNRLFRKSLKQIFLGQARNLAVNSNSPPSPVISTIAKKISRAQAN